MSYMTCVFRRGASQCNRNADSDCMEWGVGEGFCSEHIALVRARLHFVNWSRDPIDAPTNSVNSTYVEDYIKLFALMLDKRHCRSMMESLNNEMKGGTARRAMDPLAPDERYLKRPDDKHYIRLSRVLEYYEGLCWFPTTHLLYTGALSSENYQQSIALGYMPKDAGAGAQHGEFSHRLQWHLVMRAMTENFSCAKKAIWNHSPLDLFCQLGAVWAMQNGLWGVVFDNQDGKCYDNPAILNMDICGNFKWRSEEAELSASKFRDGNKLLAFNMRRRTSKRMSMSNFAINQLKLCTPEEQKLLVDMEVEQDVMGLVEKWKKLGLPGPDHMFHFEPRKVDVIEKLALKVWKEFKLEKTTDIYEEIVGEPNALLRKGDKLMTADLIRNRIAQSNRMLNDVPYTYTKDLGAYPKNI